MVLNIFIVKSFTLFICEEIGLDTFRHQFRWEQQQQRLAFKNLPLSCHSPPATNRTELQRPNLSETNRSDSVRLFGPDVKPLRLVHWQMLCENLLKYLPQMLHRLKWKNKRFFFRFKLISVHLGWVRQFNMLGVHTDISRHLEGVKTSYHRRTFVPLNPGTMSNSIQFAAFVVHS